MRARWSRWFSIHEPEPLSHSLASIRGSPSTCNRVRRHEKLTSKGSSIELSPNTALKLGVEVLSAKPVGKIGRLGKTERFAHARRTFCGVCGMRSVKGDVLYHSGRRRPSGRKSSPSTRRFHHSHPPRAKRTDVGHAGALGEILLSRPPHVERWSQKSQRHQRIDEGSPFRSRHPGASGWSILWCTHKYSHLRCVYQFKQNRMGFRIVLL